LVVQVADGLCHVPQRLCHLGDALGGILQTAGQVVVAVLELPRCLLSLEALLDELIDVSLAFGERVVDALLTVVQLARARLHLVVRCTEVGHRSLPSSFRRWGPLWTTCQDTRVSSLLGLWGGLPTLAHRSGRPLSGHPVLRALLDIRKLGVDERHVHRHRPSGLYEDPSTIREVGPFDPTERHLEQRVAIVGVRLERYSLAGGLPFTEHTRASTRTADVGLADEEVIAVVDRL